MTFLQAPGLHLRHAEGMKTMVSITVGWGNISPLKGQVEIGLKPGERAAFGQNSLERLC